MYHRECNENTRYPYGKVGVFSSDWSVCCCFYEILKYGTGVSSSCFIPPPLLKPWNGFPTTARFEKTKKFSIFGKKIVNGNVSQTSFLSPHLPGTQYSTRFMGKYHFRFRSVCRSKVDKKKGNAMPPWLSIWRVYTRVYEEFTLGFLK